MIVLDTNTLIYFFKGQGKVADRLLSIPPGKLAMSTIVLYELEVGIAKSNASKHRRDLVHHGLEAPAERADPSVALAHLRGSEHRLEILAPFPLGIIRDPGLRVVHMKRGRDEPVLLRDELGISRPQGVEFNGLLQTQPLIGKPSIPRLTLPGFSRYRSVYPFKGRPRRPFIVGAPKPQH